MVVVVVIAYSGALFQGSPETDYAMNEFRMIIGAPRTKKKVTVMGKELVKYPVRQFPQSPGVRV